MLVLAGSRSILIILINKVSFIQHDNVNTPSSCVDLVIGFSYKVSHKKLCIHVYVTIGIMIGLSAY